MSERRAEANSGGVVSPGLGSLSRILVRLSAVLQLSRERKLLAGESR